MIFPLVMDQTLIGKLTDPIGHCEFTNRWILGSSMYQVNPGIRNGSRKSWRVHRERMMMFYYKTHRKMVI